jgi:hypothetical protein
LIIHRLIVPLTLAVVTVHAGEVLAQGAFPARLPNQPQANDPAFPPVNGAPPIITGSSPESALAGPVRGGPADECMRGFAPLREDAEKRGKLIKTAAERHAPPDEACKLIMSFSQAEIKMIKYLEGQAARCGIPAQVSEQLKTGHKNTEGMQQKVCQVALRMQQQKEPAGPVGDFSPASKREPTGPVGDFWIVR